MPVCLPWQQSCRHWRAGRQRMAWPRPAWHGILPAKHTVSFVTASLTAETCCSGSARSVDCAEYLQQAEDMNTPMLKAPYLHSLRGLGHRSLSLQISFLASMAQSQQQSQAAGDLTSYMLLMPACDRKALRLGCASTSFCGTHVTTCNTSEHHHQLLVITAAYVGPPADDHVRPMKGVDAQLASRMSILFGALCMCRKSLR